MTKARMGHAGGSRGGEPAAIEFEGHGETYRGTGRLGRQWLIRRTLTGWQLEFRDPGDVEATYAGNHASLVAAQSEANR